MGRKKKEGDRNERSTLGQLAKQSGANRTYIWEARKLMAAHPELADRVRKGELTIQQAKRLVGWDKPKADYDPPPGIRKMVEGALEGLGQLALFMDVHERRALWRAVQWYMRVLDLKARFFQVSDEFKAIEASVEAKLKEEQDSTNQKITKNGASKRSRKGK